MNTDTETQPEPPPVVKDSLIPALPMDDDIDEPLGPAPTHWMPLPPPPTDETE